MDFLIYTTCCTHNPNRRWGSCTRCPYRSCPAPQRGWTVNEALTCVCSNPPKLSFKDGRFCRCVCVALRCLSGFPAPSFSHTLLPLRYRCQLQKTPLRARLLWFLSSLALLAAITFQQYSFRFNMRKTLARAYEFSCNWHSVCHAPENQHKKRKKSAVCLTQQTGWPLGRSIKLIVDPLRICVKPMSNWCWLMKCWVFLTVTAHSPAKGASTLL